MSSHQPGEYEITNKYFSQDTLDRMAKKANDNYETIFDDKELNLDSFSFDNNSNNSNNNNNLTVDTKSTAAASSKESYRSKKKMAAEAGFSVRDSIQKLPQDTFIQINSASSPDSAVSPVSHPLKEDSRSELKVNIDAPEAWKQPQYNSLRRSHTLSKPERQLTTRRRNIMRSEKDLPPVVRTGATKSERANVDNPIVQEKSKSPWVIVSKCCTCWALPACLRMGGMTDKNVVQAWREKVTLCLIILLMMIFMGFFTFGLQPLLCRESTSTAYLSWKDDHGEIVTHDSSVLINGIWYSYKYVNAALVNETKKELEESYKTVDISNLFRTCVGNKCKDVCKGIIDEGTLQDCSIQPAKFSEKAFRSDCVPRSILDRGRQFAKVTFKWEDVEDNYAGKTRLSVYNGFVMNITAILTNDTLAHMFHPTTLKVLEHGAGRDISRDINVYPEARKQVDCLLERYKVGVVDTKTTSCYLANIIMIIFLIAILGVVLTRFFMALIFSWFIADKLTVPKQSRYRDKEVDPLEYEVNVRGNGDLYVICLVTCYSEGKEGLQITLNSLASTTYHDKKKLLFVIADGEVVGLGNDISTPEIARRMIYEDPSLGPAEPKSYLAVAIGEKQHNMAKVYAGTYQIKDHTVPIVIVAKCGTPAEKNTPKPGNRGKRDSQIILMNFLSRVLYNDRMTPLDYELFTKIHHVTGVTPDQFEIVMMVDADTKVLPDSLSYMVNAMRNDPEIMGLCGETRIANKTTSWVTCIQVFEYYISHHLSKAFESVFGGVTCLPGCFCMYRIKAPKINESNKWIPILANVDIVEEYSENIVDTLHKKNLLLLGEDRFLSTLMLNTFPRRKMVFIPQAKCKTIVPDRFNVLLSQRRRWINSTIHNLMELVLVKDLCGTFCFSMQFVVGLELFGTVVLPAAICFTIYLVAMIIFTGDAPLIPILMLVAILGLPGVLILLTSRKLVYVLWMLVYLLALPIWNLVLPLYAFWHFDDFSWGETRKVHNDNSSVESSESSELKKKFDVSTIPLRKWEDYELEARRKKAAAIGNLSPKPGYSGLTNPLTPLNVFAARDNDSIKSGKSGKSNKSGKSSTKGKKKKSAKSPMMSPVMGNKSPIMSNKSPIMSNKSPIMSNKSPIMSNKSPIMSNKSPVMSNKSPMLSPLSDSSFNASSPNQYISQLPPMNIKTNQKIIILPPQTQQQLQQQQLQQQFQLQQQQLMQQQQLEQIRQSFMAANKKGNGSQAGSEYNAKFK